MRRPPTVDILIAAGAAGAMIVDGLGRHDAPHPAIGAVIVIAACAPLAWRRQAPLPVLIAVFAGVVLSLPFLHAYDAALAAVLVPLYTVAERGERRRTLAVGAVTGGVMVVLVALIDEREGWLTEMLLRLLLVAGALIVGDAVRVRRALAASAARERDAEADRRIEAERLAIAREVHDTVAHALVAINVRASVSGVLGDTAAMPAALAEIEEVSRDALADLRGTLGLLRQSSQAAPTSPEPDLADVPRLVERTTAAGVETDAQIDLGSAPVPAPIGQAGYRIIQESLTNVMRHAAARHAYITVQPTEDGIEIVVRDDGHAQPSVGERAAGGHGLQGMRERAAALGGAVDAGPRPGGGWQVTARLPLIGGRP